MIRIYTDFDKVNKNELFDKVDAVLAKRQNLWERYSRGIDFEHTGDVHYEKEISANDTKHLQVLFEKFIVDIAAGYLSGEITYDVDVSSDVEKRIGSILGRTEVDKEYAEELRYIINTLATMNNDDIEEVLLFKQTLLYGSTYERVLEDKNNNYRYYNLDALNTVAIWDNNVVPNLVAVISAFETEEDGITKQYYRVYGIEDITIYSRDNRNKLPDGSKVVNTEDQKDHNWHKVPVVVYESDFSILDKCESLITAYETLLNNVRNTYQYNDVDCKMKISGYRPQNLIMIPNPKKGEQGQPDMILNPARQEEDDYVMQGKTFYVQEGGDVEWLVKPVDAGQVTTMLKYYVDSIFQMCGIPNTADLAFNSGDLNASAIDRKFYVMNIVTANIREGIEQLIRNRFEMLLERINFKANKKYQLDNVTITIATNLPSMTDETIDQMMRLNGILSEETILERLGYDYETEKDRKEGNIDEDVAKTTDTPRKDDEKDEEEEEGDTGRDNDSTEKERNASKEV